MQRVIVNMQSYIMSDAIKMTLKNNGDFSVEVVLRPQDVAERCYTYVANVVIMEVTAYMPWKLEERLKLRTEIKKKCPTCKVAILIDEKVEKEVAEQVKQTKLDGLIDQFIYGSISASYLVALLETI